MAKRAQTFSKSFTFMCLFVFMLNFHSSHGEEEELGILLSFKTSINDPLRYLSNWVSSSTTVCTWYGITCDNSSHVAAVELPGRNISGNFSSSILQLPYVKSIDLSNNQLAGEITLKSFSPSSLRFLNLSNNNLTGSLPQQSLFSVSFSHLDTLDLSNNMFSGKISNQIGLLSNLTYLDLGGNALVGKIPDSITNMTSLQYLTLASNQLVGEIPQEIGQLKSLKWIYFGYNNLSGEIPNSFGELMSLNHLDIVYNNLTGQIPESLGNLTNLKYLFLFQNKFTGPIPLSIFELRKLVSLDLSDNSLTGEIPELVINLQKLQILHLFSNTFTGTIPKALASLPRLQVLQLWSNRLIGEIPGELGKHSNLTVLDLSTNNLSGKIPDGLCDSGNLYKLILFSNSLEGQIPDSISSCRSLGRVRIQNNKLSGALPSELTNLPQVYFLDISGNELSGRIDNRKWDMPALQMLSLASNNFYGQLPNSFGSDKLENLDLSENGFSGSIPPEFGSLSELMQLKLSNNKLTGNLPEELSSCKKLVALDLSYNQLRGQIPVSLADMPVLSSLDLSENQLSGEIPNNLGRVASLVQVNISYNHFHGSLPSTGVFLAINASEVVGNNLCDGDSDASSGLPRCKTDKNPAWWFISLCFLLGLAAITLVAFVVVFVRRRKNLVMQRVENEDGTWEMQFFDSKISKLITLDDVLSSAKEGNVISKGKNWVSYKGKCMQSDMQFVVKEISDLNSAPVSFWEEMVEFGKLRHPNIVKLMAICKCGKRGYYYLVYEFVEGKSLSQVLRNLSWERRRKIAVGIAKALKCLHGHSSSSFVVGEMSPERVLVDGKDVPRLKLIPPGMLCTDVKGFMSSAYVAPEAKNGKDATEKSDDIYGFGLILIELLTGRSPADTELGMHQSIVEWARYCYSDCHLDMWIDPMMKGGQASNSHNDVVETMNLALHCTATDPTARPGASDVFRTLEAVIKPTFSCVSTLRS